MNEQQIAVLRRARTMEDALRGRKAEQFLKYTYGKQLYGGWYHKDGRWITKPHRPAIKLHSAARAIFCPACLACGERRCDCIGKVRCEEPLGLVNKDPNEKWPCPKGHGEYGPWDAYSYRTIFCPFGNRGGKDYSSLSEYVSWWRGVRPWDGTITAPRGSDRYWGIACDSLKTAAKTIIQPYVMSRAADIILQTNVYNKVLGGWEIRASDGGVDHVIVMSYEQYLRAAGDTNPFEGITWYAFYWSEPMPMGARTAAVRGLMSTRAEGWGRELIAATPLRSTYLLDLYKRAGNLGGSSSSVFVIHGWTDDNPSLSDEEIEEYMEDVPEEEREARRKGGFMAMSGRIYSQFQPSIHVYDEELLADRYGSPSKWPIACVIDPHDRKPHFILWALIAPDGRHFVFQEYPLGGAYHTLKTGGMDCERLAEVINEIEREFPGGSDRVMFRIMDPNFGKSSKFGIEGTVQEEMRKYGLWFDCEVPDGIEPGHAAVRRMLSYDEGEPMSEYNRPRLFIHKRCASIQRAMLNYAYRERRDDEMGLDERPLPKFKDGADVVRYLVMADLYYDDWTSSGDALGQEQQDMLNSQRSSGW